MSQRILLLALILHLAASSRAAGPVNGDFETGVISPWNVSITASSFITAPYIPYARVVTPGPAPNTNGNLNMVNGGNYSCELYSGQGDNGHFDSAAISQSFTVDPLNTFLQFNVAAVLDGSHASTPSDDAYFEVVIYNAGGSPIATKRYYYASSPSPLVDDGVFGFKHLPWTNVNFSLGAYVGQTLTIEFSAHDCEFSGHDTYAYVDGFQLIPTPTNSPTFTTTPTCTITPTWSPTPTFSDTSTVTLTNTVTSTRTPTPTVTPTYTVTCTWSPTPSRTITPTFSVSPTFTVSPTQTPTWTITQTFTITPTPVDQAGPVSIRGGYPNPFKETGHYIVVLKGSDAVEFAVFNVAGEIIYIEKRPLPAGMSIWDWDGINDAQARLASGIYIIRAKDLDSAGPPVYFMTAITR